MINILIVEDLAEKAAEVKTVCLAATECTVVIADTVHAAGGHLKERQFDLMVLDVKLPMRSNDPPRSDAGEMLLQQMKARREFKVPFHVIGLTAYEEALVTFKKMFEEFTWILIQYEPSSDLWKRQLTNWLQYAASAKEIAEHRDYETDLAIITALPTPELDEVLRLDAKWERRRILGDDTAYYAGHLARGESRLTVVAAAAIQVGMAATLGVAMKVCQHFKPKYLAMTGIAAGVKGSFGEILVADRSWDYGSGKLSQSVDSSGNPCSVFEPAPTAIPMDAGILEKMRTFARDGEFLKRIELGWPGTRAPDPLKITIGPIASGAAVVENRPLIESIQSHDRKLIGVEMEIYGLYLAARICPAPRPVAIAIKSICDFADLDKTDTYQRYAAYTSARCLEEFALAELTV